MARNSSRLSARVRPANALSNYYAPRDGSIPELEAQGLTDSELLRRHLADAHASRPLPPLPPRSARRWRRRGAEPRTPAGFGLEGSARRRSARESAVQSLHDADW
jgi:hypothetical protein